MSYVYKVSAEDMKRIREQPAVSEEFLEKCKRVAEKYKKKDKNISECLYIGVDFSSTDEDCLVVMRKDGDETYVVNQFRNDEALELYNKLIRE